MRTLWRLVVVEALAVGAALTAVALWLWWVAALGGWHVTVWWDLYGEGWMEGVLLHLIFIGQVVSLVWLIRYFRRTV